MKNQKTKITQATRDAYSLVGRCGGRATFKKNGRKHMSEIGKLGAKKRWGKRSKKKEVKII
jgi:general stress protein YciG